MVGLDFKPCASHFIRLRLYPAIDADFEVGFLYFTAIAPHAGVPIFPNI